MKKVFVIFVSILMVFLIGTSICATQNYHINDKYDEIFGNLDSDYEVLNQDLIDRDELELDSKLRENLRAIGDKSIELFVSDFNKHSNNVNLIYNKRDEMIHINFNNLYENDFKNIDYSFRQNSYSYDKDELKLLVNDLLCYNMHRKNELNLKNEKYNFSQGYVISDNDLNQLMEISGTQLIRKYFRSKGYIVSLAFFNHSLLDNPSNLRYKTEDERDDPIVVAMKEGLYENDFVRQVARFGYEGTDESNVDGDYIKENYFSEFNKGDLKYAIHGLHNIRFNRMRYARTYFRFFDVYDFNSYLTAILDLITSGTTPYNITVEGLVVYDSLR